MKNKEIIIKKIITYDQALEKVNNGLSYSIIKNLLVKILKLKRLIRK